MRKADNKTKALANQSEELRAKLKEKDTMLRIAKFKLSEVQRNIKHNQLKPMPKEDKNSPRLGAGGGVQAVSVSDPAEENKARLAAIEKSKKLRE
jgi:hypothetical protein